MTPSWYDVLDVDPTASTEEIRGAWKTGVAGLEPGNRRFRALNDAAEVLLDPVGRAEHDAALAADADADADAGTGAAEGAHEVGEQPGERTRGVVLAKAPALLDEDAAVVAPRRWAPPVWALLALTIVTAVLVGLCVWQRTVPTDDAVRTGGRDAQATAERAAVAVLSYDYQDLDASQAAASAYLTPAYRRDQYDPLFELIKQNAPSTKTVVTVDVVASGIVRTGDDRVSVLVFVNRPTLRADSTEPTVFRDQVTMDMVEVDDEWLVGGMETNDPVG
jgi:Mce-associated membrane protein